MVPNETPFIVIVTVDEDNEITSEGREVEGKRMIDVTIQVLLG